MQEEERKGADEEGRQAAEKEKAGLLEAAAEEGRQEAEASAASAEVSIYKHI